MRQTPQRIRQTARRTVIKKLLRRAKKMPKRIKPMKSSHLNTNANDD